MSSIIDQNRHLSKIHSTLPSPPRYEAPTQRNETAADDADYTHGPWLLRRTSIHVETTQNEAWQDDSSSHRGIAPSVKSNDEKKALRNLLTKFANKTAEEQSDDSRSFRDLSQPHDSSDFGTRVFIEAAQPAKVRTWERHEMKGLEQAASVKRWSGSGEPAEPWGKLAKDPELWDPAGDTLAYFGYQRPQPSFRVKSAVLERTRSEALISMLREGYKRTPKTSPSVLSDTSLSNRGAHRFALGRRTPHLSSDNPSVGHDAHFRYEIHFPAPDGASRTEILRYHITTRNFFAFLLTKPLVGLTYYQALIDLHERLLMLMPKESNCTKMMIEFLMRSRLHNVSNDPAAAAGLLAYSEDNEVQWREGWREGFVHCSGMYTKLRELPEFRDISHITRTLLERSHLELLARIQVTEGRLSTFDLDDIWPPHTTQRLAARTAFDHFRRFLLQFYEKAYKTWPPRGTHNSNGNWLTRSVVRHLQKDFGALYDYYVDREVVWARTKEPGDRYRVMVRKKNGMDIAIQDDGLDIAKLFYQFDRKHKCPHIPHPYPLLPDSMPVDDTRKGQHRQSLFINKAKAVEKKMAHAYLVASNALVEGPDVATNSLVEAFQRLEKADQIGETDPRDARKGRWILLFGILQVLSHVSADTPGLWFTDNVTYFLMPHLKGMPPWAMDEENVFEEAAPAATHCWKVSKTSRGEDLSTA